MTRLQNHQQKQFMTKIAGLGIILILILYFIFSYGIRMLLNVSVYIANIGQKDITPTMTKTNDVYGTLSIDSIPTATNSSRFTVGGSIINYNILEFFINGEKVKESSLNATDSFTEEIGDLKKGENEVFIKAKMRDSTAQKQSPVYTILYKSEKPKLEIKEPGDNNKVSKQEITIKGATDKETYIRVNDLPVVVDAQGNFETSIKLNEGDNKIAITAEDIAGNIESKTITVVYQKDN